ncbi:hypothetical protein D187_006844 [Cystobacter fuscus DSM 2262]|uniref:Uncharacterized protein n=1 Tax=Cystobacter fuscus (strain ATCC 25194 / DSM 2262 / NBRC 100088 / M29) TaxID=1242864 RepID=S9NY23_CYSF2|nr:hypothetical protein [Cystobacter fuscus]EPX57090.1 hypothetical protein D187_006844 [Cystobacter fuscus DSM 2262]
MLLSEPAWACYSTDGAESLTKPREFTVSLPTGESLSTGTVVGRVSILHAIVGTGWYQFDLNTLAWG